MLDGYWFWTNLNQLRKVILQTLWFKFNLPVYLSIMHTHFFIQEIQSLSCDRINNHFN